ncbi:MAG TPA: carbamoyl-phosphate synthase domain-containing protein, partial [Candidatus Thermoplasmatota archaeon]|nr:carbamoyl-phosphate synthase domain-containing protein [Candidatus Thermoplasmatota archaeon]
MGVQRISKLVLEDGSIFSGLSFGSRRAIAGEVVFNTGMVGYPESLTDPSYKGQILVLTYPLIGNYGVPGDEKENDLLKYFESDTIQVEGLIVANYSQEYSHWNAKKSLSEWLKGCDVPALTGIDTRQVTKKLRKKGTLLGKIVHGHEKLSFHDPNKQNLAALVSVKEPVIYRKGERKILLIDCGTKNSIIRAFLKRNFTVVRVPWDYDFSNEDADG